jgi:hypothetical protein
MYSKQEASVIKKNFWTSFGQYMRPLPDANGEPVNWLNYKTGIRHIYFRMDVNQQQAAIAIEIRHPDITQQEYFLEQLQHRRKILEMETGEPWKWELHVQDEDGSVVSRIGTHLLGVNIFNKDDWPAIISFLKPRIIALDAFWKMIKDSLEV